MTHDQDEFRIRAIRATLSVVGIAAVIGLVVGGLTAGAVYLTGLAPTDDTSAPSLPDPGRDNDDELPTPSLLPTESPTPQTSAARSPAERATPEATAEPTRTRKPRRADPIRLSASSDSVGTFDRVTLSGRYPGYDGASLQVQRREGGTWVDFPTSASVEAGSFSTYVASGQSGPNAFRVLDPSTGRTSNIVIVTVS